VEHRVAVVTGAGRGLGRAFAERLAADGFAVVAADIDGAAVEETSALGRARGLVIDPVVADLASTASIAAMVGDVLTRCGRIDVLVSNAATQRVNRLLEVTEADWDCTVAVNQKGLFFCLQSVARHMVARGGGGTIINMASACGRRPNPILTDYCATKAAVIAITQAAAKDLAPHGVTVNAICPGLVDTPLQERLLADQAALEGIAPAVVRERRLAWVPLGREASVEDVAGLVAFLVSPAGSYITGQAISIDGGMVMQ